MVQARGMLVHTLHFLSDARVQFLVSYGPLVAYKKFIIIIMHIAKLVRPFCSL